MSIILDQTRQIEDLENELKELREELDATSQGTLALYNEIGAINAELEQNKRELENKNIELLQAMQELKESEEKRTDAVRTAAIGSIVVTYNHEINNPLAVIFGSVDILKMQLGDDAPENVIKYLDKIAKSAQRVSEVVLKIKEYEQLLPKSYLNWDMLDLDSTENTKNVDSEIPEEE